MVLTSRFILTEYNAIISRVLIVSSFSKVRDTVTITLCLVLLPIYCNTGSCRVTVLEAERKPVIKWKPQKIECEAGKEKRVKVPFEVNLRDITLRLISYPNSTL